MRAALFLLAVFSTVSVHAQDAAPVVVMWAPSWARMLSQVVEPSQPTTMPSMGSYSATQRTSPVGAGVVPRRLVRGLRSM